jgi:hypothetical protein
MSLRRISPGAHLWIISKDCSPWERIRANKREIKKKQVFVSSIHVSSVIVEI